MTAQDWIYDAALSDLVQEEADTLSEAEIASAVRNKANVAAMYSDHGDTVVQQNMVVHNLEPDMY
jgi:hypothetical protein